jgi:serine/threonine-protein kinase
VEGIPTTIGRYVVEGLVGVGAMGRIFKAHDPDIRRTVAIKLISTKLMSSADRADYVRRFRREAEAAARCVHANIVTIYDFALHEGEPFLAMEFVYGTSLRQTLDERPTMGVAESVGIMLQVLDALACMHAQGVIHQDIKPANIMLAPNKLVKVGDFGVSRISNTETTTTFATAGTPAYMSPEQCRGAEVDGRSDLFAAGTTLYEMVAGQRAFSGRNVTEVSHRIQNERLPLLPADVRAAVPRLQLVLERATEKHPEDRFLSAADMREALKHLLENLGDEATRIQAADRASTVASSPPLVRDDQPSRFSEPSRVPDPSRGPETSRSLEPSRMPESSRVPESSRAPRFDADMLRSVEEKLKAYIGPIATVLVRAAANRSRSTEELFSELALSVRDEAERERFRREVESVMRLRRTPAPGTSSLSSPGTVGSRLPEPELDRAQAALTEYVGPIARVLVRQAAAQVSTVDALWQRLASHVEAPAERAAFLRRRP